jgi:hypothetical protein
LKQDEKNFYKKLGPAEIKKKKNYCKVILATSFVKTHVKFIIRQANKVAHKFTQVILSLTSFIF